VKAFAVEVVTWVWYINEQRLPKAHSATINCADTSIDSHFRIAFEVVSKLFQLRVVCRASFKVYRQWQCRDDEAASREPFLDAALASTVDSCYVDDPGASREHMQCNCKLDLII